MQLQEEKVELESRLEMEQEYLTNRLQRQLATVLEEKKCVERGRKERTRGGEVFLRFVHRLGFSSQFVVSGSLAHGHTG